MAAAKLKVLLVLSHVDGEDVGEALVGYRWAKEIAKRCDVTILTQTRKGHTDPVEQFPECEVITWPTIELPARFERVNALMKPGYPIFVRRVRKWIRSAIKNGRNFDVIHQLNPNGIRYAPATGPYTVPYIVGPQGGSLPTPEAFKDECGSAPLYSQLRNIDPVRIKYAPTYRASFQNADLLIGVGGYVEKILDSIELRSFKVTSEQGLKDMPPLRYDVGAKQALSILHVGRGVRTKGLRDLVRAMAQLKDKPWIRVVSAGFGEEIEICKQEAISHDVAAQIDFRGKIPHAQVMRLMAQSDLFVFPSFREPSGGVVFEAMSNSLPVITANLGGPASYVTKNSGIKIDVQNPEQLATDVASAIRKLDDDRKELIRLSQGAYQRMIDLALWDKKMDWLMETYDEVITEFKQRNQ
jgi:glycosyltransferase involved in cell wall biosynthesis